MGIESWRGGRRNSGERGIALCSPRRQWLARYPSGLNLITERRSQRRAGRMRVRLLQPLPLELDKQRLLHEGCQGVRTPRRLKDSAPVGPGYDWRPVPLAGGGAPGAGDHTLDSA